jgi:hypothetical protein
MLHQGLRVDYLSLVMEGLDHRRFERRQYTFVYQRAVCDTHFIEQFWPVLFDAIDRLVCLLPCVLRGISRYDSCIFRALPLGQFLDERTLSRSEGFAPVLAGFVRHRKYPQFLHINMPLAIVAPRFSSWHSALRSNSSDDRCHDLAFPSGLTFKNVPNLERGFDSHRPLQKSLMIRLPLRLEIAEDRPI